MKIIINEKKNQLLDFPFVLKASPFRRPLNGYSLSIIAFAMSFIAVRVLPLVLLARIEKI